MAVPSELRLSNINFAFFICISAPGKLGTCTSTRHLNISNMYFCIEYAPVGMVSVRYTVAISQIVWLQLCVSNSLDRVAELGNSNAN